MRVGVWEGWVGGLEVGTQRWFGQPAPILTCSPKVTSLTRYLYLSHHLGNSKCFKTSVPGSGGRDLKTYVFVLPNSSIREKSASFVSNKVIKAHMTAVRQFSSVAQSCPTLCDPLDCSTPGLPVDHQLPGFTQTHIHRIGDEIQPSFPLLSLSPPAFNLSHHQGLF